MITPEVRRGSDEAVRRLREESRLRIESEARWRTFAAWCAVATLAAGISLAALGARDVDSRCPEAARVVVDRDGAGGIIGRSDVSLRP